VVDFLGKKLINIEAHHAKQALSLIKIFVSLFIAVRLMFVCYNCDEYMSIFTA